MSVLSESAGLARGDRLRHRSVRLGLRVGVWRVVATVLALAVLPSAQRVRGEERLGLYFDGLRQKQMFAVAEGECLRRLARQRLGRAERTELVIELSKTYAMHASYALDDEQRELWLQAASVVDELLQEESSLPLRVLLEVQRAMVPAARGAHLRWQGELMSFDEATRREAALTLEEALQRLAALPGELDSALRVSLVATRDIDETMQPPLPARLHQLRRTIDFATAAVTLDRAKVLPPGVERTAALQQADERFAGLSKLARPDGYAWEARVQRLDIIRLSAKVPERATPAAEVERLAIQQAALLKLRPPAEVAHAAVAVVVRGWMDANRPEEALAALETHREQLGLADDQLQALIVESLLAARRIARDKQDEALSAELLKKAKGVAERLDGPWGLKARRLLERVDDEDRYGPELARHVDAAQWAWHNGNLEAAIAGYARAAAGAHQQGRPELAAEFAFLTGSLQIEAGQDAAARETLTSLLDAYPTNERAADADLLRAYALGRLFEQHPVDEHRTRYGDALQTHRTAYAGSPTASEATWMLARLREYEQDWPGAIALLAAIPEESPRYGAAMARSAAVSEQLIEEARNRGENAVGVERQAAEALTAIVARFPSPPSPVNADEAEVAWRLARMHLRRSPPNFAAADGLLDRVTQTAQSIERDGGSLDDRWQTLFAAASQLRIVSLAGQGKLQDARLVLERVVATQPQQLLITLNGMSHVAAQLDPDHRAGIGRLQLELAQRLQADPAGLTPTEQRSLEMTLAEAHGAVGQWQEAARLYEELLWKTPQDRPVMAALARLYEECGSPSCLRQALKQWRSLEALQAKGSVEWLESRYHLAWCSHHLGDDEAARKLIGVTQVLYPDLGTPALANRFELLRKELDR